MAPTARRPPTEEPRSALVNRIPKSLHRRLRVYCVERGIEVQQFVTDALREWLAKQSARRHAD